MIFKKTRAKLLGWLLAAAQQVQSEKEPGVKEINCYPDSSAAMPKDSATDLSTQKMTLNVYPGSGGLAIEVYQYDRHTDRSQNKLHIIPDGEELSEAIAKIITLESLR